MSNLKNEAYTPATIDAIKFRIPLYQRPYAWEKFQVEQLMKDLEYQFMKDRSQKYYIGILNVGKTTYNKELFDLIDGQQRITTLNLIGKVLKEYYPLWDNFLHNRLELFGRKEDQLFLEKLEMTMNPNPKMPEAIDCIRRYLNENISEKAEFSKYVYVNAAFFITEVPEQYTLIEKNLQFVRMNNRGKQLEPHDVLKIKLATAIDDNEKQKDFIKRWNKISQLGCKNINDGESEILSEESLIEILNQTKPYKEPDRESEIFYQSIISYSEFLLIALDRFFKKKNSTANVSHSKEKLSKGYLKDRLLEEFGFGEKKVEFDWSESEVIFFIDILEKQFELFDRFIIKRDKEDKYKFRENYKDNLIGGSLLELQVFQSFLYVSREPSQHNWLIDAFDYLEESVSGDKIDTSNFLTELKHIDNMSIAGVKDISLKYGGIERHWFWRLDYYLWENREVVFAEKPEIKRIADKYTFRLNRSIEHIAPQNPNKGTDVVYISETFTHCFGNLAMISSGQNSSLQNSSFEIKRAHVFSFIKGEKSGSIESLKMLDIYECDYWNEENLKKHSDKMLLVLINSLSEDLNDLINFLRTQLYEK